MMNWLTIHADGKTHTLEFTPPLRLADALRRAGIDFSMPCAGNHACGRCAVRAAGALDAMPAAEQALLGGRTGFRLACTARAVGDAEIWVESATDVRVQLDGGATSNRDFAADGRSAPIDGEGELGLAVDVGTTTLAAYLVDLRTHKIIDRLGRANPQTAYGADVLSRVRYAVEQSPWPLQDAITGALRQMLADLRRRNAAAPISRAVICGNTAMLYLLTGTDTAPLAAAPFSLQETFGRCSDFAGVSVYYPPCLGAFIGADVTCAVLSTGLTHAPSPALLVDIGTNGEAVLHHGGRLYCTSTAAGPAFEGGAVTMGMPALDGAVDRVGLVNGKLICRTLGNRPPKGICGAGLISALSLFARLGLIDSQGAITGEENDFACTTADGPALRLGDSGLLLTQNDIRAVQPAKAALAAGIDTLLHAANLTPAQLRHIHICGGFGSAIDYREAAAIGLLPKIDPARVLHAGNAAGNGAVRLLSSGNPQEACAQIRKKAVCVDLPGNAYFEKKYLAHMSLTGWQ